MRFVVESCATGYRVVDNSTGYYVNGIFGSRRAAEEAALRDEALYGDLATEPFEDDRPDPVLKQYDDLDEWYVNQVAHD